MATPTCHYIFSILNIIFIISNICIGEDCQWTVNDNAGNPHTLDLSCIAGEVLIGQDAEGQTIHDYLFSICQNSQPCGSNGNVMVAQRDSGQSNGDCFNIGIYDSTIQPDYGTTLGGAYTFQYNGGNDCQSGRTWKPTFICDASVEHQMGHVTETSFGSCQYEVTIYTKYACDEVSAHCEITDSSSSGLSGGWVFIIILICGLFTYFVVGYIVMALTVNKEGGFGDVNGNIPNKELWINCIPLVIAGCGVTKEYIMALINKDGTDKGEALTESEP
eukprot:CAMPEP_0201571110 /NCGR_PEP_ID=MMETSP0190_2-20130828/13721_1 /ASSEMBLY_ACC=CAM_ASM_000263 /TAXON_ID=37353 /ORGANISM="Rosalina sp." /LENGTH=274 /DNA_ID=CAMNT_0047995409 /DNA_START=20 /DNA_END=844 /DNA_ORIENTATION=+